jgi:hypothetical protein
LASVEMIVSVGGGSFHELFLIVYAVTIAKIGLTFSMDIPGKFSLPFFPYA